MNNIELLPHNEKAYQKLIECLKNNQMASINHATGTGKSFIILKYMYENRDKNILYLSPVHYISNQMIENYMPELGINYDDFKCLDFDIYRSLIDDKCKVPAEDIASKYDIIILDEYHRCGAKKWGQKVKIFLDDIKANYPAKKVVGLTATEIRYLDHNRNMNDQLFDGVEASRLTLSDAIIAGILPAPVYISFNFALLEELDNLEKKIKKYCIYQEDLEKYLLVIRQLRDRVLKQVEFKDDIKDYIDSCSKYLAFSPSIDQMEKDAKIVKSIIGEYDEFFSVHNRRSKEKNQQQINSFTSSNKKSILFSVDLLTEGIHIKSVDAICMLRRTTSPRIYFQQLGRVLSYSRRNDSVVVLDFVNNIQNHNVIYDLYLETVEKVKKLIEIDPDNKEKYERILHNFRIVDKSSAICKEIEELKAECTKTKIIERRLLKTIEILEHPSNFSSIEYLKAKIDIIKSSRYLTPDVFARLKNIDGIEKPEICLLEVDEFNAYYYANKKTKDEAVSLDTIYVQIEKYFAQHKQLPSLNGTEEETYVAQMIIGNIYRFSKKMINFITDNISDNLTDTEKEYYLNACLNVVNVDKVLEDNTSDEKKDYAYASLRKELVFNDYFTKIVNEVEQDLQIIDLSDYLKKLYDDIEKLMTTTQKDVNDFYQAPSKYVFNSKDDDIRRDGRKLLCKKLILNKELEQAGYLDKIEELARVININNERRMYNNLIDFMKKNNGLVPSYNNPDPLEKKLARYYYRTIGKMNEKDKSLIEDIKLSSVEQQKDILNKYLSYVSLNGSNPSLKVEDEELLALEINRLKDSLSKEDKQALRQDVDKSMTKYMVKNLLIFMKEHNGELPSNKNNNYHENKLALLYNSLGNYMSLDEQELVKQIQEQYAYHKDIVINKYVSFVEMNRRLPFYTNCSTDEITLNEEINRLEPYLDNVSAARLKKARKSINKYQQMQDALKELEKIKSMNR